MNNYNHVEHYNALMALCADDASTFYYVDQYMGASTFRIFSYRLASYTDFLKPYALMCRGHMFEIDVDSNPLRMASFTMDKFFNNIENPMTMDLNFSNVDLIMDKMDGSLISSYNSEHSVRLKSKTSLFSEQSQAAETALRSDSHGNLNDFIDTMTVQNNYTVNMEYTAPNNHIVVRYKEARLTVLNVRNNDTSEYLKYSAVQELMHHYGCAEFLVKNYADLIDDYPKFIESIYDMTDDLEGYVIMLPDGMMVKQKTAKYAALHHLKSSVDSPKALFKVVVLEAQDDLRAEFADDAYITSRIDNMEKLVKNIYGDIAEHVERFYHNNKHLDRKSYAILSQQETPKMFFSLTMDWYLGNTPNYQEWLLKRYKDFGIKDDIE